ncbi:hypothetical protein OIU84_015413 [Salix udensis]|uniref:Uncharacterized protein n=1 Tax=Salix udensis TaxID=889485 RepID=A0AAD6JG61_9ROSI|nr:hypothetical protein OIU84_015413 [Salix udensis]
MEHCGKACQGSLANDEEQYGLKEMMDSGLRNTGGNLVGFGRFLELAMQCVEESATERPTMSEVVKAIEMILQNDGMNTNSTTSASSSATDFGASRGGGPLRHPYNIDVVAAKNKVDVVDNINNNNAFDYSGGYTLSAKVEPK